MTAATDWDSIVGALPVLLWIVFLALRRRRSAPTQAGEEGDDEVASAPLRTRRRRHDETPEFKRNYDPIEPS